MTKRDDFIKKILEERSRQFDLPGSEYDSKQTPAEWAWAIIKYASEGSRRGGVKIDKQEFEDSLIKAGAVVLAALEHLEKMEENKLLVKNNDN